MGAGSEESIIQKAYTAILKMDWKVILLFVITLSQKF